MSQYRKLFHEKGKNYYTDNPPSNDPSTWPAEWKTTYYKEYGRFSNIPLSRTDTPDQLSHLISRRESSRSFKAEGISISEISNLLLYSCGEFERKSSEDKHRAQPSGGARYPIEMYALILQDSDELKQGAYHYNVKNHSLEWMWDYEGNSHSFFINEWKQRPAALFVMTGVWWRTEMKYKERGSRYVYIEAGHIAQNLHLLAESMQLKSVGLGGVWEDVLEEFLQLDKEHENVVHVVALGK